MITKENFSMTNIAQSVSFPSEKTQMELDTYKVPHDIKIYPGAKHSFFNDQGRNYNANAAQDSWQRVLSFFKEHIGQ
jgi:dienelactone hydrolase